MLMHVQGNKGKKMLMRCVRRLRVSWAWQKKTSAVASTGVIGELLQDGCCTLGYHDFQRKWERSAMSGAIFTSDSYYRFGEKEKLASPFKVNGKTVTIAGAAKGSGMIHPNMATMLGFMTSDAVIGAEALQRVLRQATNHTFNMITVDGDTSTNDMLVAMSSGMAGNEELDDGAPGLGCFCSWIHLCMPSAG